MQTQPLPTTAHLTRPKTDYVKGDRVVALKDCYRWEGEGQRAIVHWDGCRFRVPHRYTSFARVEGQG